LGFDMLTAELEGFCRGRRRGRGVGRARQRGWLGKPGGG
jgi:hypothetical protein